MGKNHVDHRCLCRRSTWRVKTLPRTASARPLAFRRKVAVYTAPFKIARCTRSRCRNGPRKTPGYLFLRGLCKDHVEGELDTLARALVMQRDRTCQDTRPDHRHRGNLQWAHTLSRRYLSTRWLDEGAVVLCERSHQDFTWQSRRDHGVSWTAWCIKRFGAVGWGAIVVYGHSTYVTDADDYERIWKYLKTWQRIGKPPPSLISLDVLAARP